MSAALEHLLLVELPNTASSAAISRDCFNESASATIVHVMEADCSTTMTRYQPHSCRRPAARMPGYVALIKPCVPPLALLPQSVRRRREQAELFL